MTLLTSILHDMEWVVPLRHDAITPLFKFFTTLGFTEFFFAALPILYWSWRKDSASRIAIVTLLGGLLTLFLKDFFQDPRPPAELAIKGTRPDSFGLPSGHTLMAIVFWGSLAFESRKRWIIALAFIMIIGIASSRLYLGVHDIEDILAGGLVGGTLLGALIWKQSKGSTCCPKIGFFILLLFPVFLAVIWPEGSSLGKMSLVGGFFIAWLLGRIVEKNQIQFSNPTGWLRMVVGIAGLIILILMAYTLRALLTQFRMPSLAGPAIGGALIGFGSTVLVPWFLLKLKLLQRSNS